MKILFSQKSKASHSDITDLEKTIETKLPISFVRFVSQNDGALVSANSFLIGDTGDNGIHEFIPITKIMTSKSRIEGLDQSLLPFAYAEGGDVLAFHLHDEFCIYYWSHEDLFPAIKISTDFEQFMESLIPKSEGISEYTLQDGEEVWADPEFEKLFPSQFTVKKRFQ